MILASGLKQAVQSNVICSQKLIVFVKVGFKSFLSLLMFAKFRNRIKLFKLRPTEQFYLKSTPRRTFFHPDSFLVNFSLRPLEPLPQTLSEAS